jgi:hypothetical protein
VSSSEGGSLGRAALRIKWASRALNAAAHDLQSAGATAAADVVSEEADRVEVLAGEVRELGGDVDVPAAG